MRRSRQTPNAVSPSHRCGGGVSPAHAEAQGRRLPAHRQGGRALHQGGQDLCHSWGRVQEGAGAAAAGREQVRLGSVCQPGVCTAGHRLPQECLSRPWVMQLCLVGGCGCLCLIKLAVSKGTDMGSWGFGVSFCFSVQQRSTFSPHTATEVTNYW